ncbi:unnamed protein product [Prorocentrum cordatum]|uniref:Uncharacterized protein n=3 Tax=Prorocentrum cordatum TaxID=2364126 RepID=A0ABN9SJQ6_9DINO|nr:unnamed protein product [Polarella glacialis]
MANLVEAMERRAAGVLPQPPWRANVSFASTGCAPQVCGGAGWVLSAELAERLCLGPLGDAWIHEEMNMIVHPRRAAWYDQWLRFILRFMMTVPPEKYATVIRLEEMNEFAPGSDGCTHKRPEWTTCYDLGKVCRCSRALKPATFHLKGDWRKELDVIIGAGL